MPLTVLREAGLEDAQAFGGADGVGLAGQRGTKAGQMYAVCKIKIGGEHGAVEGGQAQLIEEMELDAGEIAVGEERLGMLRDRFEVQACREDNSSRSRRGGP